MAFLLKLFGIDLEGEKKDKFRELETKWGSDPEILKHAKVGWLLSRGQEMVQKGYPNQAIRDSEEALQIDPESIAAYQALMSEYIITKRFGDAAKTSTRCLDMIEKSGNEEVKMHKMHIYFMQGMIGLEMKDMEVVAQCFLLFLKQEKKAVTSPVWQKMVKESNLVSEHILLDDNGNSLEKEHLEYVRIAKETLTELKSGLNPEAQKLISEVLS
ncbi:MAG: hypothetical protein Q8P07_00895 [bacterium]|nr:hypothetical protein [bacterium]